MTKENNKDKRPFVETKLSLEKEKEVAVSDFQKEFLQDEINELPPIKEGDVNISAPYVYDTGDKLELTVYIRNGLKSPINFEKVPLLLTTSTGKILARQMFDLTEVGTIPACSVRPYKIYFDKENVKEIPKDDWKLVFENNIKAVNYPKIELDDSIKNSNSERAELLQQYINTLPKLEEGSFSVTALYVNKEENGELSIALIFRNAANKDAKLEQVPIKVFDNNNILIANGIFKDLNIIVPSHKAMVKEFMFRKEELLEQEFDIRDWNVKFEM